MKEISQKKSEAGKEIDVHAEKIEKKEKSFDLLDMKKMFLFLIALSLIFGVLSFLFTKSVAKSAIVFAAFFILFNGYFLVNMRFKRAAEVRKMEDAFPDFIELMASNLRAGMTIDKAMLLSSRKEFEPLDKQIILLGKDIVTGKEITQALDDGARRIGSEKITKTMKLIISGIKSGGNLAVLLEETAQNLREKNFVEKRAASNVLMYVIFIFFASAIGAPTLFALSSVLVEIMTQLVGSLPEGGIASNIPFALSNVSVSVDFVIYFSIVFVVVSNILASLVLGLVSKGREKEGFKYSLPMILLSVGIFFVARLILGSYFSDLAFG